MDLFTSSWEKCFGVAEGSGVPVDVAPPLSCVFIVIQNLVNASLVLAAVVAVFFIMYAAFQYATSAGDKEKVDTARKRIVYAIIGIIVIFFAFSIVNLISVFTGVTPSQLGLGS